MKPSVPAWGFVVSEIYTKLLHAARYRYCGSSQQNALSYSGGQRSTPPGRLPPTRRIAIMRASPLLSVVPCLLGAQPAHVVLDATPETRVTAGWERSDREVLTESEREEARVLIIWDGEVYRWIKRAVECALVYNAGILLHTFVDPCGGGWVRVLDQRFLLSGVPSAFDGPALQFFLASVRRHDCENEGVCRAG